MKTSYTQYYTMVDFMEKNGDLSKPSGAAGGRHFIKMKWAELASILNGDPTGEHRSEEKWRKVWSDFKNNTKRKPARINNAASGTGGSALQLYLTDLENRVMQIIGVQAATGMAVVEAGFPLVASVLQENSEPATVNTISEVFALPEEFAEDWNTPGSSSQPTVMAPPTDLPTTAEGPPASSSDQVGMHKYKKKPDEIDVAHLFMQADLKPESLQESVL